MTTDNTKIMVTGGEGFVGKHLICLLKQHGYTVFSLTSAEFELTNPAVVLQLLKHKCDYIFHLAGLTRVTPSWMAPADWYRVNYLTTLHVLEYARLTQTPMHFISAYIYGNQTTQPTAEDALILPNNPYAHSKWLAEQLCQFYHQQFKIPITISRPFNMYGPKQSRQFFIANLLYCLTKHQAITIDDITLKRDYIHVDDACRAFLAIMQSGISGEVYNVGNGRSYSGQEIIDLVCKILDIDYPVVTHGHSTPNDLKETCANIKKIARHTGWIPQLTLDEGLRKMIRRKVQ